MGKRASVSPTKAAKAVRKESSDCEKVVEAINAANLNAGESEILKIVVRHVLKKESKDVPHDFELRAIGLIDACLLKEADSRREAVTELESELASACTKAEEAKRSLEPQAAKVEALKIEKEAMENDYENAEKSLADAKLVVVAAKKYVEELATEKTTWLTKKEEYGQVKQTFAQLCAGVLKAEAEGAQPAKIPIGEKQKMLKLVLTSLAGLTGCSPAMIAALKACLMIVPENRGRVGHAAVSGGEQVLDGGLADLDTKLTSFDEESARRDNAVSDAETKVAAETESKAAKLELLNAKDDQSCEEQSKAREMRDTVANQAQDSGKINKKVNEAKQHVTDYEALNATFNRLKEQAVNPTLAAADEPMGSGHDAGVADEPMATGGDAGDAAVE